jgi:hypothetical protein
MTSAIEIHTHLLELQAERALASIEGLAVNSPALMAVVRGDSEQVQCQHYRLVIS